MGAGNFKSFISSDNICFCHIFKNAIAYDFSIRVLKAKMFEALNVCILYVSCVNIFGLKSAGMWGLPILTPTE